MVSIAFATNRTLVLPGLFFDFAFQVCLTFLQSLLSINQHAWRVQQCTSERVSHFLLLAFFPSTRWSTQIWKAFHDSSLGESRAF